jgi:hypothetical protein
VGVPAPAGTVARRRWPRWAVPAAAVALAVGGAAAWRAHVADGDREAPTSAGATAAAVVAVGRVVDYRARAAGAADLGPPLADMLATNLARAPGLRVLSAARVTRCPSCASPRASRPPRAWPARRGAPGRPR